MKQKLLKTWLMLCLLLVGAGTGWAADFAYKTAKFGTQATSGTSSGYTSTYTSVTDGFSVSVANGNTNGTSWDCVKFGRKGNASVGTITTSAAIDKAITKVVLTIDAITATNVNSIKLYTGATANACTTEVGTFSSATGDQTVNISSAAANKFYKVSIDCKSGSGNGFVAISKVVYYYDDAAGGDSGDGDGDDDSERTITINMDKLTNPNTTSTITYGTYNWISGAVSGVYNGASSTSNTSFQFNYSASGSSNYRDKQALYNTVAVPGKITSIKMVTASGSNRTWTPYVSSSAITPANYTSATALTAKTVNSGEGTTWEVTGNNTYFYLNYTTGSASYIGDIVITYTTEGGEDPEPEKELIAIQADGTPAEFWKGDAFNHDGITVTATWDDETETDVTSSCSFAGYDMSTAGEQTVTVTYEGETCQYGIEVKTIANTQETAYTIDEAIAKYNAGKDLTSKVYVKGTVSEITTAWSDQYNNITYAISADGQTTGTQFLLYRCVTNGASAGDDVVAYGTLSTYSNAVQLAAGNEIVKIEKLATLTIADITVVNGEDITPVITTNVAGEYAIEYTTNNEEVVIADGDELVTNGAGTATITATLVADGYKDAQTTFNVTVTSGATLTSVTLSGELTSTIYTIGDAFDHTGLVATANYSDDTHVDVTETATWEVDPETLTTAGNITVTVSASFGGQEDIQEYEVTVNKKTASISFAPATIDVEVGKNITLEPTTTPADAEISYTITEGAANVSIDGAVVTGVAEGTATIRADYAGNGEYNAASTTVTINIIPADESFIVTQTGFSSTSGNMVDDTNGEDANISYEAFKGNSTSDPAIPSNTTYLRLYQNGGYVTIKGAAGVSISQVKITTGSTYESTTVGYCVDDEGAPTTGETVAKNSDYTITDLNNQSVSIYCLGTDKNTRLDIAAIEVKYTKEDIALSSIALSGEYQTEFIQNQTFNHDGIVVTANFSNGQNEDVTAKAEFTNPDMTTTGTKTITVSYTDAEVTKTAEYDITVAEEVVTAIALSGEYQTTFRVGDTFNHDNLEVKATYNSGRTNIDVTSEATVSTPDMSVAGEQTVTVSYGGQNANYTIKVLSANTIFYESFDTNDGTGGNDGQWSGQIAANNISSDNANWTFAYSGGANKCAKFGTGSGKGAATTPALGHEGTAIMTFKSAAWNGGSESLVVNLSVEGDGAISQSSITNKKGEWTEYTVTLTGLTAESKVKFEAANSSNNRFFLDEVLIIEPNELNLVATDGEGNYYATFSSTKDVAFVGAEVYTITVADDALTLTEVTGKQVPAGNGVLIKSATTKVPYINVNDAEALGDNMLVACTTTGACPAVVGENYYFKLAYGDNTNKTKLGFWFGAEDGSNSFNVKAGGAVLVVPQSAGVKGFSFDMMGNNETAIEKIENTHAGEAIYNLQGIKLQKMQKGINIVNGRKVIR